MHACTRPHFNPFSFMSLQNEIVKLMVALEEIQGLTKVEIFQSGPQW